MLATARPRWEAPLAVAILAQLVFGITAVVRHEDVPEAWTSRSAGACTVWNRTDETAVPHEVLELCTQAVPAVTAVWGRDWGQRATVVVVPGAVELSAEGAPAEVVAQAEAGQVFLNAHAFRQLSPSGREVVLTHEITHLATGAVRGRGVPTWLLEGFADYVGFLGSGIPVRRAAQELRDEVRAGELPDALPSENDFEGLHQPSAYAQSWLAVSLLVRRHGEAAVVRLYRAVAKGTPVERALVLLLDTSLPELIRDWRADLQRQLR